MVAGVDPVYGLYTGMVTTIVAALTGSTSLMIVTLTNALALVTADALAGLGADVDPIRAMFTLTFLVGAIMFLLGVLRLGSVIRFVSAEVMSGFVFATALLIVLGQYDELVGYVSTVDANKLIKAVDITLHIGEWDWPTVIVGVGSIIVLVFLKRIKVLEKYADVLIIFLSSVFVFLAGWATVELVGLVLALIAWAGPVLTPILLAWYLAALSLPGYFWLQKRGVKSGLAMLLLISVLLIGGLAIGVLVIVSVDSLQKGVETYLGSLDDLAAELQTTLDDVGIPVNRIGWSGKEALGEIMRAFLAAILEAVKDFFFSLILVAFFLLESGRFRKLITEDLADRPFFPRCRH
jgi:MFS superfamily sulfate permease-like transporter